MKTNIKITRAGILTLVLFCFITLKSVAQVSLLDSVALFEMTAVTSIDEAMKNPDKVIKLELNKQKLKEFPKEILSMHNLQYLDLGKNKIKDIPPEIGQLKNLQWLSLSKNDLQDLPLAIGELTNLYYLNVNQNKLQALPGTIGNLINLKVCDLWSNEIYYFPDELKYLKYLQVLDLRIIQISEAEQNRISKLLPETKIFFSPYCTCQQ